MIVTYSLQVDLQVLICARCGRNTTIEPVEMRRGDNPRNPAAWRVSIWRQPVGWEQFRWPNGDESAACADCWPEVKRRAGLFIEHLRDGVKQWVDPLTACARPGCGHVRAAHVDGCCSTLQVGCSCTSFVEPSP